MALSLLLSPSDVRGQVPCAISSVSFKTGNTHDGMQTSSFTNYSTATLIYSGVPLETPNKEPILKSLLSNSSFYKSNLGPSNSTLIITTVALLGSSTSYFNYLSAVVKTWIHDTVYCVSFSHRDPLTSLPGEDVRDYFFHHLTSCIRE